MTVYVVTSGEYSDYYIHGVYSTLEKAEQAIDMEMVISDYGSRNDFDVEEYELDDLVKRETFRAHVHPDGCVAIRLSYSWWIEPTGADERLIARGIIPVGVNYHPNRKVMEQAARDKAAMIRARDMGL